MTEPGLVALRQLLIDSYDDLKARLTRRLGSTELAHDALQDTWLRLARLEAIGTVHNPGHYLLRTVLNVVQDRKRSEKRHLSAVEIDALLNSLTDEKPGPAEVTEARSELKALAAILAELPPRRRAILLAARLDNMPREEIARRLGISLRLVGKELQLAHEYCLARQGRKDD
jgi:RNA polymerase sigma-70 factor (ECF subfamily)